MYQFVPTILRYDNEVADWVRNSNEQYPTEHDNLQQLYFDLTHYGRNINDERNF